MRSPSRYSRMRVPLGRRQSPTRRTARLFPALKTTLSCVFPRATKHSISVLDIRARTQRTMTQTPDGAAAQVVIVGGGFGGLAAAKALAGAAVQVTLVDRLNYHLFQPLLYQVALASLSATDIAAPIRSILRRQRNVEVILGEVTGFDLDRRRVRLDHGGELPYDYLIVAAGARTHYY